MLADADRHARNTLERPDRVRPTPLDPDNGGAVLDGDQLSALLPPLSWNVIRLTGK